MSKSADQRKHPRIGPVLIRADFWFENRLCRGYVTNLSLGGAFLATRDLLPVGSRVRMLLSLPWNLGPIEVEGTVVWRRTEVGEARGSHSPGMGLQFLDLGESTRRKIESYLDQFHILAARLPERAS